MTAPIRITAIRPGPSGAARAGATTGFTNLAADVDTNFAATRSWATDMQTIMTLKSQLVSTSVITPAAGWTLTSPNVYNVARRIGRQAQLTLSLAYTGSVVSSSVGDVNPDLLIGTIAAAWRPYQNLVVTGCGYTGVFVSASAYINAADGTMTLTGMSAAITATNPGFVFTINYLLPLGVL
jgi:hypothetical protein